MILKINYLRFNWQSLNSNGEKICTGSGILLHFNDHVKLHIYYILKKIACYLKISPVLSIECNNMNQKRNICKWLACFIIIE